MSPPYKLYYFNGRGAAETIRLLFSYGKIDFEDVRIEQDQWPTLKPSTPFGQLPCIEQNGKKVNQSVAIERFVAKKAKLTGKDEFEDLEIDAVVDTITDLKTKLVPAFFDQNPDSKKTKLEELQKETVPFYLGKFEKLAENNGGHLVANKLTWADFHFVGNYGVFEWADGNGMAKYPHLKKLKDVVEGLPGVKEWIAKRPKTQW